MGLAFTGPVWGRRDSPSWPLLDNRTGPCPLALISDPRQSQEAGLDDLSQEIEYSSLCFPGGSVVKNLSTNVGDAGWKDPLEKEVAIHSSVLA